MEEPRLIAIPQPLIRFAQIVGEPVYMVGGAVRNAVLGLPYSDLDVCGGIDPATVEERCLNAGCRISKINKSLGTVGVKVGDETVEYTAFRTEAYAEGGSHMPETVTVGGTMQTDAVRRDFTVNALYAECLTGKLFDPLNGAADLEKKVLRQCSPVTLASDALRILRLVRFAGELGFALDAGTEETAKAHVKGLFDIAPERRREEFDKILLCDTKYPGLSSRTGKEKLLYALELLTGLGCWPALVPEMVDGIGLAQRPDFHRHPVTEHMFHACSEVPADKLLRLAALLHDIGKPAAFSQNGNYHFHDRIGAEIAWNRLNALRYSNLERDTVTILVRQHMFDLQGTAKELTIRRWFRSQGRELAQKLILIREADVRGSGIELDYTAVRWRRIYETMCLDGTPWTARELALDGREIMCIMDIKGGPRIGSLQQAMLDHCLKKPKDNTKERLTWLLRNGHIQEE